MQFRELEYKSKEEWHELRRKGIGGSDCSIIMGENPHNYDIQKLWRIKTGREEQEDLSEVPAIKNGVIQEPYLRGIFQAKNPDWQIKELNKTLQSNEYPFMLANLDGVIINENGEVGILEIKTATVKNWEKFNETWKYDVPLYYYLQVQHYLAVTGWKYAVLFANVSIGYKNDYSVLKSYPIQRDEDDIKLIIEKEKEFYNYIKNDIEPIYTRKLII